MMRITPNIAKCLLGLLIGLPGLLAAADLDLPASARVTVKDVSELTQYNVPTGPWHNGTVPSLPVQGRMVWQVWQSKQSGKNTLQVLTDLREQLLNQGYTVLFECHDWICGGFDFRFGIEALPGPEMYVDLGNYRFLSATRKTPAGNDSYITLLVSQSAQHDFVQNIYLAGDQEEYAKPIDKAQPDKVVPNTFDGLLEHRGSVILSDLVFKSGSSALTETTFVSLKKLATYMKTNPKRRIALVGHTDSIGDLDKNMALSKQRAQAVAAHLVKNYEIDAKQISAEGTGYLSPISNNLTAEGRKANRRVEAVLLSHQ
jgi:OOP family OmpA-OmpF porin